MKINGNPTRTIWVQDDGATVEIIDQTLLPHKLETVALTCVEAAAEASHWLRHGGIRHENRHLAGDDLRVRRSRLATDEQRHFAGDGFGREHVGGGIVHHGIEGSSAIHRDDGEERNRREE